MKLYLFQSGTIRTKKHLLVPGYPEGIPFEVPIPFFLIDHPEGRVLFDTGQELLPPGSALTGNFIPVMTANDILPNQLAAHGVDPDSITHVVLSHLHGDHSGGLGYLQGATCYLQKNEPKSEELPTRYPGLHWILLTGPFDLFGDGRVKILPTPGHTPGHQSLLLHLDHSGEILLTGDSVYTREALERHDLPDPHGTLKTIRSLEKRGITIITGHDPEAWPTLRLAPLHYT